MIARPRELADIRRALARSPVVVLVGPRQVGKTTLARQFVPAGDQNYFDLERPESLARLAQPMLALGSLRGTIVIDEVQRRPDLFPVLRVLADRRPRRARFLVLGSAAPGLLRQSSESLAGRAEILSIGGLRLGDVRPRDADRLWLRGGFPASFVARTDRDSAVWRAQFIQTFLERDVPQLGVTIPATTLLRFWSMLAHYHGQVWNAAEPAMSLGVSQPTVRRYLDLLTDLQLVRQLQPWHQNLAKRQVKAPKVYLRDSGLLHQLLGLRTRAEMLAHPKLGASWEGFVLEEVLRHSGDAQAYFWATHQGAELDLLLQGRRRLGIEIKRADAPTLSASMRIATSDLQLDRLYVVYPGTTRYLLTPKVEVLPLDQLLDVLPRG